MKIFPKIIYITYTIYLVMNMFKDKLRFLRKQQEFNQREIAEYLGIDQTTYSRYETGATEPDIESIKKLAKLFNVSTDYLLENNNILSDIEDVVDLNNFLLNGRYTINSKFPTNKERKAINKMVNVIFEIREMER